MARKAAAARTPSLADEIAESGETELSSAETSEREVRDDLVFLAREFLTWLVFHAETDGGRFDGGQDVAPFTVAFGGKLTLRTPAGMVTDVTLKGPAPVGSPDLRYALAGGLSVKEADLRLEQGELAFTFALAADHFDLKRVKLPTQLDTRSAVGRGAPERGADREDDRTDERMALLRSLDATLKSAFGTFLELRMKPAWARTTVPAMRGWLHAGT